MEEKPKGKLITGVFSYEEDDDLYSVCQTLKYVIDSLRNIINGLVKAIEESEDEDE